METMFINTENSKTNESNRFRYYFSDKLSLKNNKTIALANLRIYFTWKNVKSEITTKHLKYMHPLGMNHLMYQLDLILFLIYKTILNILLKNMKPLQKRILP